MKGKLFNLMHDLIYFFISWFIFFPIKLFLPRNKKKIVVGGWFGNLYIDNSKYLFEYMKEYLDGYRLIYIAKANTLKQNNDALHGNFVKKGTLKAAFHIMTAKYIFVCQGLSTDLSQIKSLYLWSVRVQLWHGVPLKKIGLDSNLNKSRKNKIRSALLNTNRYTYYASTSEIYSNIFISADKDKGVQKASFINSGYPRNDILFKEHNKEKLIKKYSVIFGIDLNKKIVLFLPTYRHSTELFLLSNLESNDYKKLKKILGESYLVLEKSHYVNKNVIYKEENVFNINEFSDQIDIQELLIISSFLITDYSGVYFDYLHLNKPIIHFTYDYDEYKSEFGLYYDFPEFAAGPVVYNFNDLIEEISKVVKGEDSHAGQRAKIKDQYMTYDNGNAAEKICSFLGLKIKSSNSN